MKNLFEDYLDEYPEFNEINLDEINVKMKKRNRVRQKLDDYHYQKALKDKLREENCFWDDKNFQ